MLAGIAALAGVTASADTTAASLAPLAEVTASTDTPPGENYGAVTIHNKDSSGDEMSRWSERTKVGSDYNKDGVRDVFVAQPRFKRNNKEYGRVFLASGESLADPTGNKGYPKWLTTFHPPEPQVEKQFGFQIEVPGDLNADGFADIIIGTDAQDVPIDPTDNSQVCETQPERCRQNLGKAWAFDGKNNKVLYEINSPERSEGTPANSVRFGSRLGRAGDVTGDGVPDIMAGASNMDDPAGCANSGAAVGECRRNEGRAFIFNGANGALVRQLRLPEEDTPDQNCQNNCGNFGLTVQGPGDVDGDGVPDQLVAAPTVAVGGNTAQGRIYVFSGATGQVIRRIDDPEPQPGPIGALFGFEDVTPLDPGDVNGDGHADIYGHGFQQRGEGGPFQGKAWVFSGGEGSPAGTPVMYEVQNPNRRECQSFGWSMTRDRDRTTPAPQGTADPVTNPMYVGNDPHHCQGDQRGETNTFNAQTGAHLRTFPLPLPWATELGAPGNLGPNLGWTVSSPGDLNRDGLRDFLAGAPFTDVCEVRLGTKNKYLNVNQGVMIVFRSLASGEPLPNDNNPADNVCEVGDNNN